MSTENMKPESNLPALRVSWEFELDVSAEFGSEACGQLVVVLKDNDAEARDDQRYSVHRYFRAGSQWVVSCDAQRVSADEAFEKAAVGVKLMTDFLAAIIPR